MARTIKLYGGYVTTVSAQDYKRVIEAGPWHVHIPSNRNTVYAVCNRRKNDNITQTYLHRFIMGLTDPKIVAAKEAVEFARRIKHKQFSRRTL